MAILLFEKPLGMRDQLPPVVAKKRFFLDKLRDVSEKYGYAEIITPTLEFYETVGRISAIKEERMFKLLDRYGNTLILRPDLTTPIARVVSALNEDLPLRLFYQGNVFRAQEEEAGKSAEFFQSGVELIGDNSPFACAEILAIAIESLKEVGLTNFKIVLGDSRFLQGILDKLMIDQMRKNELLFSLQKRDFVSFQQLVHSTEISDEEKKLLIKLINLHGSNDILITADSLLSGDYAEAKEAINNLREIWRYLQVYEVEKYITFDFSLVLKMGYYTGLIMEGYESTYSFPILSGGRYDNLYQAFGKNYPAVGFAIQVDRLLELLSPDLPRKTRIIIRYDDESRVRAIRLAKQYRTYGKNTVVYLERKGSKKEHNIDKESDYQNSQIIEL